MIRPPDAPPAASSRPAAPAAPAALSTVRRSILRAPLAVGSATGLAGLGLAGAFARAWAQSTGGAEAGAPKFFNNPFTLGVASGDPLPDSVVLWTRLAPDPLEPSGAGGMPPRVFPVQWEIGDDDQLRRVVQRGTALARPELAHSVHVEVQGLEPGRWYWYRFRAGSEVSPIGRTRTAPAAGAAVDRLRFAFASCQNYNAGFYTAFVHMAREELDLVVHLGDYIYEGRGGADGVRAHAPAATIRTLAEYRVRHAQYKTDPALQAAHAAFPWIVTWDDHEVANNYADEFHPSGPPEVFRQRRAAAYQAHYEHQPLRRASMPVGPDMQLYRRLTFGSLVEFDVLDTRQYRDRQTTCAGETRVGGYCASAIDPARTILGDEQERWLLDGLARSPARWNVLAQQVVLSQDDNDSSLTRQNYVGGGDAWDGYKADRDTLLDLLARRLAAGLPPSNPMVLTGDVHRNGVYDLKADFSNPHSQTVGSELVCTAISTGGDPATIRNVFGDANDPHERYNNNNRGYVLCDVTPARWLASFRAVTTVEQQQASISTVASFAMVDGHPGAQLNSG